MQINKFNLQTIGPIYIVLSFARFGIGVGSMIGAVSYSLFVWQLPRFDDLIHDLETWKAIMLCPNCSAVGLSDVPPAERCLEKYISSGSWLKRSLSRNSTSGSCRSTLDNSVKDWTEIKNKKQNLEGINNRNFKTNKIHYTTNILCIHMLKKV